MIVAVVSHAGGNKLLKSRSLTAVTSAGENQSKFRFAKEQAARS